MGDLQVALYYKMKSLSIEEKVLPENHPQLASSYNNLALIYQDMGELEKARKYELQAEAVRAKR